MEALERCVDYTLLSRFEVSQSSSEVGGVAINGTAVPDRSFAAIFPRCFGEGADSVGTFGSSDAQSSSATRPRTLWEGS